tara:strand:- start:207 stop:1889 length:1683 start_codon:yes stop_codon:yes gene_type:complete
MADDNAQTQYVNLEKLLDLVAEALIESPLVTTPTTVETNQTFIRNGILQKGAGEGVLALFQKEVKANQEDLNEDINNALLNYANLLDFENYSISVEIQPAEWYESGYQVAVISNQELPTYDITNYVQSNDGFQTNPLNISQFIPLQKQSSNVDVEKAEEYLDTNIFELLPTGDSRQSRIIRFFQELNALLPPEEPQFDLKDSEGNTPGDGRVDRGVNYDWTGSLDYSKDNSISYAQDNQDGNIDEEDAFIHRLKSTANNTNSSRTIEDIYNTILPYLTDILEDEILPQDDRPEYQNKSNGYLQFRNPNQGIIIRNTNQDFIEGLNPSNLTYLDTLLDGSVLTEGTGFTITMWVRFLDKVSEGTLFNFGNPIRGVSNNGESVDTDAFGFRLETFVINKDDLCPKVEYNTWGDAADALTNYNPDLFNNSNTSRFVRLVVNDNGQLRDSHLGCNGDFQKLDTSIAVLGSTDGRVDRLLTTTHIPEDFQEWYFICASFNPAVVEDDSHNLTGPNNENYEQTPNFWLNHINPSDGSFTNFSNFGNKCKVEIISKTDLLRARGFKV